MKSDKHLCPYCGVDACKVQIRTIEYQCGTVIDPRIKWSYGMGSEGYMCVTFQLTHAYAAILDLMGKKSKFSFDSSLPHRKRIRHAKKVAIAMGRNLKE